MSDFTQDFFTSRRNEADGNTRIGQLDRLWYDSITNTIRVSDGVTPGGIIVSGGGGPGTSGYSGISGWSGSGFNPWIKVTSNYTALSGDRIIADTSGGSFTIDLPATPALGDYVVIADGGDFGVNPLTIGRNGSTIEGLANDYICNVGGTIYEFIYDGSTWQVTSSGGTSGYSGISGWSGALGLSGYSGIGESGFSGFSGWSGAPGAFSASGYSGFSGESGWSGYSGIIGESGYSGWSGYSGIIGESGYSGWSGYSGYSGVFGYSGYSGETGISGWSGYSGISGWSGHSGISGSSGYSGELGNSGYSGLSGYSGISGNSGYSGTIGISGYSGVIGDPGIYIGPTPPTNTDILWLDESDPYGTGVIGIPAGGNTGQVLLKTSNTDYDVQWGDSSAVSVRTVLGNDTILTSDNVIIANSSSNISLTLPAATTEKIYYIKTKGTGTVTLNTINSETIDGNANLVLSFQWSAVMLIATGTEWLIF